MIIPAIVFIFDELIKIKKNVKNEIKRLTVFLILLYIFLSKTNYTDADIFAERKVQNNKFSAITLDFSTKNSFNNGLITSLFSSLGIVPTVLI